jgi:hypothetical protein
MAKRTYEHMLGRMKKDLISLKINRNEIENRMKNAFLIQEDEAEKQRKSKEAKLQSKSVFDGLMKNIE